MKSSRLLLSLLLLLALLFAQIPQLALADGEAPPDAPTEVAPPADQPAVDPTGEAVATDVPTADPSEAVPATEVPAVQATDPAPTVETIPDQAPDSTTVAPVDDQSQPVVPVAQEQTSASGVLNQVPDGTNVVVLGTDGQPEPLASQAAANTIVNGDPMWCPAGVLPGGSGCTSSYSSFTALITELSTFSESGAGTIYVAATYDATTAGEAGSDIIFDYGNNALTDLVFQGGWDFGSNNIVGTSDLSGIQSLQFWDWGAFGFPASLTLQDTVLTGGDGLYIGDSDFSSPITTANVSLDNVSVTSTNTGTFIGTDGSVTVDDGNFDGNAADGLDVQAGGDITLNNVIADGNDGIGASLSNCGCAGGLVKVTNGNFDDNSGIGLAVLSNGNVTISDTDTFGNAAGIVIGSDGDVALTGLNSGYNGDIGVGVSAAGNVSVTDSWIGFNGAAGFGTDAGGNVTLANSAFFDNAGTDTGAYVTSAGSVNVSNSFFGNCFFGSSMCADQAVGLIVDSPGPVDISNSRLNQNTSTGLILMSDGDVFLNNVTADGNVFVGAVVNTLGNVKVCGGSYSYNDRFGFTATAATVFISEQTLLTGNGDAPIDLGPGTTLLSYNCAKKTGPDEGGAYHNVNVSGGELVGLDCQQYVGTRLILPNGDKAIYPCPIQDSGKLTGIGQDGLPGSLPDGSVLVSAMQPQLFLSDQSQDSVPGAMTIAFVLPGDVSADHLAILFWDGTKWIDLAEGPLPAGKTVSFGPASMDGFFEAQVNFTGIFALVKK